jgi:hypothetical protein
MRSPHFIVNYLEGPSVPYEHAEYAGVFMASEDAEESFAKSEPPTHDDWTPDMLDNRSDKVFVRVGMRRIKDAMHEFTGTASVPRNGEGAVPLGAFSDLLGGLIPAEQGTGARSNGGVGAAGTNGDGIGGNGMGEGGEGTEGTPARGTRSGRTARVRILDVSEPDAVSGVPVFTVRFDLEPETRKQSFVVAATPMVVLEEGAVESDPPAGSQRPRVLFWSDSSGAVVGNSERFEVAPDARGPWHVAVAMPPDAAVALELSAEDAG